MKKSATQWHVSDVTDAKYLGPVEFQDETEEWHSFEILALPDRLVFGGACNVGFLESGYMLRDECETLDETLQELVSDLEALYNNDNPTDRLVFNDRV